MSIKIMSAIWDIDFPTPTQLLIALKLADYSNDQGESIYPAKSTIARKAHCDERTVKRTLSAFRASGLIKVIREGGGRGKATEYALNLPLIDRLVSGAARIDGDCHKLTVVDVAAAKQGQIAPLSETGTSRVRNGDTHDRKTGTPMSPDSSMTHQNPSNARAREDLSNSDLDDRKHRPAVLHRFVSQDALDQVRTIAPGWDRQALLAKYMDWIEGKEQPRDMDAAFLAWCRSFTKGKPPA